MPRTFGDGNVHCSHIDGVLELNTPLHERHAKGGEEGAAEVDETIGRLIAENLVEDGATLQMGIGAIPDNVLKYCRNHKDLGIHSEMLSDGIVDLCLSGVVNGRYKSSQAGKVVGGFAYGTADKTYKFLHENPGVTMLDIGYVNEASVVAAQPKMTAINSCVEIDITGQVCSDSIGTRVFSGFGGQVDFLRGAAMCEDGKPILALPSKTKRGESKIVPILKEGAGVGERSSGGGGERDEGGALAGLYMLPW